MFEQRVNSDVLTVSTVNSQDQVTQKPRAALMMGINRGTLRKKLKKYGMN